MSKAFFRWLRGELNGYYLQNMNSTMNTVSSEHYDFLCKWKSMQFKLVADEGKYPVTTSILKGIGLTAGVFLPFVYQDSTLGSIRFTLSNKVNDVEYSERGLFKFSTESFDFKRTSTFDYTTDINTLADSENRSSMLEKGARVLGYIPEGVEVIRDDGSIDHSKILTEPPVDSAYTEYYGDDYLYLADKSPIRSIVSTSVYYELFKAMQWIRYNGSSISSLCKFIEIICPDYVFITNMDWTQRYACCILSYGIDQSYETKDKLMRTNIFKLLAKTKFPQIIFNEVAINVDRDENGKVINITQTQQEEEDE